MDQTLLDILVCPLCRGALRYQKQPPGLICSSDRLLFPVSNGVPVLIVEQAESIESQ